MLIRLSTLSGPHGRAKRGVLRFPIEGALSPSVFGMVQDDNDWKIALAAYNNENLDTAFARAQLAGVGLWASYADAFQIVDAEYQTARHSRIVRGEDWLQVEAIWSQIGLTEAQVCEATREAIQAVFAKIGFRIGPQIRVTILDPTIILPIHLDRTGYVTIKEPFAKYCVKPDDAESADRLRMRIETLAACHVAGVLSSEAASPWLITAAEALAHVEVDVNTRARFCAGQARWLNPSDLDMRLLGFKLGENEIDSAELALAQAILIGRYLTTVDPISVFRQCLTYHSPLSPLENIRLVFSGDPTRDACKHTFGYAPEYLFEQALATTCK